MARVWRGRGPVATAGPCILLAVDQDGPVAVAAVRSKDRGVKYDGVLYPDELVRDLGAGVYMLASHLMVPADGNIAQNWSPLLPLQEVSQLDWTAGWESYDRARKRLNADQLWERGGAVSGMMKNAILAAVLIVSIFTAWGGFRSSAAASDLARETGDLRGALYKVIEPSTRLPVVSPGPGVPAGDRSPTAVPARP